LPNKFALNLAAVNAYYGDSHILRNVSFQLPAGRILALLGRNGAGKSTCMNTIAGLLPARSGRIVANGVDIAAYSPEAICRSRVALVPQGRRIFRSLSVTENLLVARHKPSSTDNVEWDVDAIFGLFPRLKERHANHAGNLSGGEQQMLAIGRALMTNPKLLLMDEPTEGLAPQIVSEVGQIVRQLRAAGLSIVLVEQHTTFALRLADDVAIMSTGEIVARGSAAAIVEDSALLETHLGVH
jgi:branched-chain amino acid transport system ATP-binding protein